MPNYISDNHENNRGKNIKNEKKRLDFKSCKNNTLNSLREVEYFLNNLKKVSKIITIKRILK